MILKIETIRNHSPSLPSISHDCIPFLTGKLFEMIPEVRFRGHPFDNVAALTLPRAFNVWPTWWQFVSCSLKTCQANWNRSATLDYVILYHGVSPRSPTSGVSFTLMFHDFLQHQNSSKLQVMTLNCWEMHHLATSHSQPMRLPQGVVYKDTDFLAIDKPMGWTVNPGFLDLMFEESLHLPWPMFFPYVEKNIPNWRTHIFQKGWHMLTPPTRLMNRKEHPASISSFPQWHHGTQEACGRPASAKTLAEPSVRHGGVRSFIFEKIIRTGK